MMEKNKQCMVTDCKKDIEKSVFDGTFWIRVCKNHSLEFKEFAKDNNLIFREKDICLYCKNGICSDFSDACNNCIKKAEVLGCDVSDLTELKQGVKNG